MLVPQNGDLFEFKTYDGKTYFMFYMDGNLYQNQSNNVVAKVDGLIDQTIRLIRPSCLRNAFECFAYGDHYDTNYDSHGRFTYIQLSLDDKTDLIRYLYF